MDANRARRFYETVFDAMLERLDTGGLKYRAFPMAMGQPGTIVLAYDTENDMIGLHSMRQPGPGMR